MLLLSKLPGCSDALFSRGIPIGINERLLEQFLTLKLGKNRVDLVSLLFLSTETGAGFANHQGQLGDIATILEGSRREDELIFVKSITHLANVLVEVLLWMVERNAVLWF